jgi:HEAT repeat protein
MAKALVLALALLAGQAEQRREAVRNSFTSRVREILPGIEDRLEPGRDPPWTTEFLELTARPGGRPRHPGLEREDLEPLAAAALRGADPQQWPVVLREIERRRLRSAAPVILPAIQRSDVGIAASVALQGLDSKGLVPELLRMAEDASPEVQRRALGVISAWRAREAIPALLRLPAGGSAGQALIDLRAREVIPILRARLRSRDIQTVREAIDVLLHFRAREAVPDLAVLLKSKDGAFREFAAWALGWLRARETVPEIAKLIDSNEALTRSMAITVLQAMRDPEAAREIRTRVLIHPSRDMRSLGFVAACTLSDRDAIPGLVRALRLEGSQEGALSSLVTLEAQEAVPEILALLQKDPYPALTTKTIQALIDLRAAEAVEPLKKFLDHSDPAVRAASLRAMVDLGAPGLEPRLIQGVKDPDPGIREASAYGLGVLRIKEGIPGLRALLEKDTSGKVRRAAAANLSLLEARDAIPAMLRLFGEGPEYFGEDVAASLGRLNVRSIIPVCVETIRTGNETEKNTAVAILGTLRAVEAAPGLVPLLKNRDATIRMAALRGLEAIRSRDRMADIVARLRDDESCVRSLALHVVRQLNDRSAAPALMEMLEVDDEFGLAAGELLVEWGIREAFPLFRQVLAESQAFYRPCYASLLLRTGDGEALPGLLDLIEWGEKGLCLGAVATAMDLGVEPAIPSIVVRLSDGDPEIRRAVASALCRLGRTDGVDVVLEEVQAKTELNALRQPQTFRRLDRETVTGDLAGTAKQIVERIAKEAGLAVEAPADPAWASWRVLPNPGDRLTRLQVLEAALPSRYELICEPDRIRILTRMRALDFWRAWWAARRK